MNVSNHPSIEQHGIDALVSNVVKRLARNDTQSTDQFYQVFMLVFIVDF